MRTVNGDGGPFPSFGVVRRPGGLSRGVKQVSSTPVEAFLGQDFGVGCEVVVAAASVVMT
jgi:hypothetical protein